MKLLYKAKSIIERDSLRARLHGAAIASDSPERTMSRKVTDQTVDLSLGGYSVFFDGFPVLVPEEDMDRAREVLAEFQAEMRAKPLAPAKHWNRAYSSAIFSFLIPVIFNLLAVYNVWCAWRDGEVWPHSKLKAVGALACWLATTTLIVMSVWLSGPR